MNKRILFFATASLLAGTSQAQTVYTWSGTDGLMNTAANWSPAAVPLGTVQDRMLFNGTSAVNAISFPGGTFGGNPGLGGVTVAAAQTNALTMTNTGASGSVFRLNSNAGVTVESGAGALTFGGSGVAYIINLGSTAGTVNTFTNDSANTATVASNVNINTSGGTNGQAAFTGTGDWVIAGNITGAVSRGVIKNGTGNLTLSGTGNNFVGLTINGGVVRLGNNEVINNNQTVTVNAAGILNLNAFSETVNGITGTGMIQNEGSGTSTLTVGANNGTTTFTGTIRNNSGAVTSEVALTKMGTGTLTLAGTNNYTGLTTVSGGTLAVASNIPGNALAISGGSLGGEATIGGNVILEGGSGLLVDPTTVGALHVGGNLSLMGAVNLALSKSPSSTAPFTLLTYAGSLTGPAASITLIGGVTTYRNPLIDDSLPNIITATVGSETRTWKGGVAWDVNTSLNWVEGDEKFLQLDSVSFGDTGAGTVAITGVLAPASITVNSALDYTFTAAAGNVITGSTGITKSGAGTLNLGGVNTFTGNISVNEGTLKPTSSQALGANFNKITIAEGAVLDTNGMLTVARDYAAVISGAGI